MTYLDYINLFWRKDREYFFAPDEVAIYFRLLNHANSIGWKTQFNLSLDRLMLEVGIKSRKPFDTARKNLRDAGLLEFENGNGRGCTTKYTLLGEETTPKRGAKNPPLSGTLSGEVLGKITEGFGKEKVAVHKTKSKSKNKEANASTGASENSALNSEKPEADQPEPWATWLAENAPDVQRMKEPLTAEQWASLLDDYPEATVKEVLQAMHNTAGAERKYKSANLTARAWCKRRCPEGKPKPAPKPAAKPTTSPVNPEAVAENTAKAAADLARQQAEFQARQAAKRVPA